MKNPTFSTYTAYEDRTERLFRNVGILYSEAWVSPKGNNKTRLIDLCEQLFVTTVNTKDNLPE
jgi:hypothetical protein